jgi:hypothetical protein
MLSYLEYHSCDEAKIITKVNSKGKKRKRMKCKPGFKLSDGKCIPQSAGEKRNKKVGLRKAVRTKKAGGAALKRRTNLKRKKALRKRKNFGL